jgi:hypothetical protein
MSVRIELGSHWRDFRIILCFSILRQSVQKIQVSSKYDNNRYFTGSPICIHDNTPLNSSQNDRCLRQKLQRKSKHILRSIKFFLKKKKGRLWDNVENILQPDRPHMTIRRMRIACWVSEVTDTLRICKNYYLAAAAMVTRMRLNITLQYIASLVYQTIYPSSIHIRKYNCRNQALNYFYHNLSTPTPSIILFCICTSLWKKVMSGWGWLKVFR